MSGATLTVRDGEESRVARVYLAGKIRPDSDWRNALAPHLYFPDNHFSCLWDATPMPCGGEYVGPYYMRRELAQTAHASRGDIYNMHDSALGFEVAQCCRRAIRRSDIVFAWIDSPDCHGTLVEVGYATAYARLIGVYYASEELESELWFPSRFCNADGYGFSGVYESAEAAFSAFIAGLSACHFVETSIDYREYIRSDVWRVKALKAKEAAGWRCQVCNVQGNQTTLNAHHRTYERLGNESDDDITVLCRACHELFSKNGKLAK